jgi:hypothetical protein
LAKDTQLHTGPAARPRFNPRSSVFKPAKASKLVTSPTKLRPRSVIAVAPAPKSSHKVWWKHAASWGKYALGAHEFRPAIARTDTVCTVREKHIAPNLKTFGKLHSLFHCTCTTGLANHANRPTHPS